MNRLWREIRASEVSRGVHSPDRIWISPDIVVAKNTILQSGKNIVRLRFPGENGGRENHFSLRSKYAQTSCHPLRVPVRDARKNRGQMTIQLLAPRPVILNQGEGISCFYDLTGTDWVLGRELYERAFEGNGIKIEGTYGEDWYLYDRSDRILIPQSERDRMQQSAIGIALRLKDKRLRIKKSKEPIDINNQPNYRAYLDTHVLEETPVSEYTSFWVSETRAVATLSEGYNGVLNNTAPVGDSFYFQTHSTLIKGGKTHWPIRSEFWDLGIGQNYPHVIRVSPDDYNNMFICLFFWNYIEIKYCDNTSGVLRSYNVIQTKTKSIFQYALYIQDSADNLHY